MVVKSSIGVVDISYFRNVCNALVGHLEDGQTNCNIVGGSKILSVVIFEVLLLDIPEQLSVESSEMRGDKCKLPVAVILNNMIFEWPGEANIADKRHEVAINKPTVMQLELRIK